MLIRPDFDAASLLSAGRAMLRYGEWVYEKAAARELLWHAQDRTCACCSRRLMPNLRHPRSGDRTTIDHVQPIAFHGPDKLGNIVLLTHNCNHRKHQRWPSPEEIDTLARINARLGWPMPNMLKP